MDHCYSPTLTKNSYTYNLTLLVNENIRLYQELYIISEKIHDHLIMFEELDSVNMTDNISILKEDHVPLMNEYNKTLLQINDNIANINEFTKKNVKKLTDVVDESNKKVSNSKYCLLM